MSQAPGTVPRASEPTRIIRPVTVPAQFFVLGPILAGFLAIFPGFFSFVVINMLAGRFEPVVGPALVVYVLAFVAILAMLGLRAFQEPGLTSYAVYRDRIEFEEGLLNRRRRTVLLDRIIDVRRLNEGVLQRAAGAGSITLVTQGIVSQGDGRLSNRTFHMGNVPDPAGAYELIRSLALGSQGTKAVLPE